MSCERYADALLEHALGEPAPPELEAHLAGCVACRAALHREQRLLGRIDGELHEAISVTPNPEFLPRVQARVADAAATGRPWRLFWLLPVAASVVALVAAVSLQKPSAPPAAPRVAESTRPIPEARVSVPAPPARPLVRQPRLERAKSEPEVLVPPGEEELFRRFVGALQARRVDASGVVAGDTQAPSAELAIPTLDQIPPLEVKPLPSGLDPEGVNR